MRFVSVAQMQTADRTAQERPQTAGLSLMLRAGTELARHAAAVARLKGFRRVLLLAGKGNNGGDAFIAAGVLRRAGYAAEVWMAAHPDTLKGDALKAFNGMRNEGVPYSVLAEPGDWESPEIRLGAASLDAVLVDALLGTGCKGAPHGAVSSAIRWINAQRGRSFVLAADIPSGINGDTGTGEGAFVRADLTVTFARPKTGFSNPANAEAFGEVAVADIGMPDEIADAATTPGLNGIGGFIAATEILRKLPHRPWDANKGTFGKLCIRGGSHNYPHAPILAAAGASRSGVGLLFLSVPEESRAAAACHVPEAVVLDTTSDYAPFDVVVLGPGLHVTPQARLDIKAKRLVLDAGGLTVLAQTKGCRFADGSAILTPHPGEAARLLGCTVAEVQKDRAGAVRQLADRYNAVVVLKGAGTLVCRPGEAPRLNLTGNPGMATGGTGDVLAGLAGGLFAQGMDAFDAACLAVWAHGRAGDLVAWRDGPRALTPLSLAAALSFAD